MVSEIPGLATLSAALMSSTTRFSQTGWTQDLPLPLYHFSKTNKILKSAKKRHELNRT